MDCHPYRVISFTIILLSLCMCVDLGKPSHTVKSKKVNPIWIANHIGYFCYLCADSGKERQLTFKTTLTKLPDMDRQPYRVFCFLYIGLSAPSWDIGRNIPTHPCVFARACVYLWYERQKTTTFYPSSRVNTRRG